MSAQRAPARLPSAPSRALATALVEPLTNQESEIQRLIAADMRNQEIADSLFLRLPTVTPGRERLRHLGVSHRTEAVAKANELNLPENSFQ